MIQNRFAHSLLAAALLITASLLAPTDAAAQAGRTINTSGKANSSGKVYEPIEPPALPGEPVPPGDSTTPSVPATPPAPSAYSAPSDPFQAMFQELERFHREMDEFIARRFSRFGMMPPLPLMPRVPSPSDFGLLNPPGRSGTTSRLFRQSLHVRDEGRHYVVDLELPEKDQPNVEVKVEGQVLRISATHREMNEQAGPGSRSQSYVSSSFQQSVTLPGPVKADAVRVERDRGRLKVIVPKA
mgnify:CR=1 FL=1